MTAGDTTRHATLLNAPHSAKPDATTSHTARCTACALNQSISLSVAGLHAAKAQAEMLDDPGSRLSGARTVRYLCIKYPRSSPKFVLALGSPRSRLHWTANVSCKARYTSRNMRIQQHKMSLRMRLTNNIIPTSVGVNTFTTIVLLTVTTNCDGGALVTTQHTHFYLILSLILRGGRVALVRPNMRRNMVPWSVRRVVDLPPDTN